MFFQPAHDSGEVDSTLTEFGEDAGPQRLVVVPSLVARAPCEIAIVVLEMDVPDAVGPAVQRLDYRRPLIAGAEQVMPGIEDDTQDLRIGFGQKAIGLSRCLHPASRMGVEDRA